jgi:hypothetical protein
LCGSAAPRDPICAFRAALQLQRIEHRQIDSLTRKAAITAETLTFLRIGAVGVGGVSAKPIEFPRA